MRKSIVIAVSIASSLALTACGNSHQETVKAKVAAAQATGDTKQQKANYDDIAKQIESKRVELRKMNFHRADAPITKDGVVYNLKDNVFGRSEKKRQAIDKKLSEMNELADSMITAAKDINDQGKVAHAQEIKQTIAYAMEKNQNKSLTKQSEEAFAAVASIVPNGTMDVLTYIPRTSLGLMGAAYTKVVGEPKPFSADFAKVKSQINANVQQLNQMAYHEQDEQYSVASITDDAKTMFKSRSADELAKIKSILETIQTDAADLVKAAANDDEKQIAAYVSDLAKNNIADIEKAQKKQQKAEFKAKNAKPVVWEPLLGGFVQ